MIVLRSYELETNRPIVDDTETFADIDAVAEDLRGTASDEYADEVLAGLAHSNRVRVVASQIHYDVWTVE
jgi:predicted RecB family endonuclease